MARYLKTNILLGKVLSFVTFTREFLNVTRLGEWPLDNKYLDRWATFSLPVWTFDVMMPGFFWTRSVNRTFAYATWAKGIRIRTANRLYWSSTRRVVKVLTVNTVPVAFYIFHWCCVLPCCCSSAQIGTPAQSNGRVLSSLRQQHSTVSLYICVFIYTHTHTRANMKVCECVC